MAVQHGARFRVGLIDRQMQTGVHRGALADHAVQAAFDQPPLLRVSAQQPVG